MNFEDLGKKFKKFSQDTVTEVQKMNEVRQVNNRVSEQKKQIAALYSQIGQKLYDHYKDAPLEGFEREFQELGEHYAEIEKCTEQVRRIRGVRVCPNCHTEVSVAECFCSSCGEKLPEVLHIEEDEEGKTVIEGTASEVIEEVVETAEEPEEAAEKAEEAPGHAETAEEAAEKTTEAEDPAEATEPAEAADEDAEAVETEEEASEPAGAVKEAAETAEDPAETAVE